MVDMMGARIRDDSTDMAGHHVGPVPISSSRFFDAAWIAGILEKEANRWCSCRSQWSLSAFCFGAGLSPFLSCLAGTWASTLIGVTGCCPVGSFAGSRPDELFWCYTSLFHRPNVAVANPIKPKPRGEACSHHGPYSDCSVAVVGEDGETLACLGS